MKLQDILQGLGRGAAALGTFGLSEVGLQRERDQLDNQAQLANILSGQTIPAFARAGGAEPSSPEQIKQAQLAQLSTLAGQGSPEALKILAAQSPLAQDPMEQRRLDIESRKLDVTQEDIDRKAADSAFRQQMFKQFTAPEDRQQIINATKPITTNNFDAILKQSEDRLNKAAQFAAATGDKTLLDAAKAQYDVALDKYERSTGKDIKDSEFAAAGFFERMNAANKDALDIGSQGFPTFDVELISGVAGKTAANFAKNPMQQKFARAADDWIRAKLRKESGAVIADEEMKDEFRTYFPVIGDSPEVIDAKAKAREIAMRNMGRAGSRALSIQSPEIESSTSNKDIIATNPKTGQKLILRNGQWQPM